MNLTGSRRRQTLGSPVSPSSPSQRHGVLLIDKPAGWTSHDVVARLRRLTGVRKIGHSGTLDPFATGLLIVAVGRATRLLQFGQRLDKGYLAHVVLGASTDTLDVDGTLVEACTPDRWPARADVEAALARFVGMIEQIPPKYSAIRVAGRRLYDLARAGEDVEVPKREVQIDRIDCREYAPPDIVIGVDCGSGTYIRSLARDLGDELSLPSYCHALRRTRIGRFSVERAWTMAELERIDLKAHWQSVALHPDALVEHLPAVILPEAASAAWYHGRPVDLDAPLVSPDQPVRVYDAAGEFAGIGEIDSQGSIRPRVVFIIDREVAGS